MPQPEESVLVSRLRQAYWPTDLFSVYSLKRVLAAEPISEYVPESRREDAEFDLGRVHHFYNRLQRGETLDAIELDTAWSYSSPTYVVLIDGHHRFAAAVLSRKRRIAVSFSGPVEYYRWLSGETNYVPRALEDFLCSPSTRRA